MKLTILGTGNATVTECYNTCFALSDGNRHFLVDTGGGNRILKVLKDTGIQLEDIHDIFITHEHIDHLLGVIWLIRMIGQKKIGQGKYEGRKLHTPSVFTRPSSRSLVNAFQVAPERQLNGVGQ